MGNVISEQQRLLNEELHKDSKQFGNRETAGGFAKHLPKTLDRLHELNACNSFLDYGTGKGRLVDRLKEECNPKIDIRGYDPAVSKFSKKPNQPFDIVGCFDVLEHIEMSSIESVLNDINQLTKLFCYLVIDLQPAIKTMSDGRNAHILLAPPDWWINRVSQIFPCVTAFPVMHACGLPQKLVIACSQKSQNMGTMYSFLMKMKIFDMQLSGGTLHKKHINLIKSKKKKP